MWTRHATILTLVTLLSSSWTGLAASVGNARGQGLTVDALGLDGHVTRRADPNLAGYLGVFFLGADPYVYFYLSNGNDALSFKALNRGAPIMRPTKGTGGVRDPTVIPGGGSEAGKKWYIIGTDLHIGKTTWDAAQRQGSKGIFIWESTDLVNWVNERLVTVEDGSAGMVWAPEAIWDPAKGQYLVHWASKFYPASDPRHTGSPSNIRIRYAYTSDFRTFSAPQTLIDKAPTNIIDLTFLPLNGSDGKSFVRFMKDETKKSVFAEYSNNGLFGTWTRPGGDSALIQQNVEGPTAYLDNLNPNKVHLLLDFYGADGYRPYQTTNPASNSGWAASSRTNFPANLRHGSVLPVNQTLYNALRTRWGQ
ncbi:glycosyl hydrolase [Cladorrhinum sp. PSN332]|nr:glycosyl hydrolase [Cladorrhinum sp. PSN332]